MERKILRLAICDDDPTIIEQLEIYIEKIEDVAIIYEVYFSPEELMDDMMEMEFDAYILDIQMENISGIELAKKIHTDSPYPIIVFITSYSQYVFDVFDVMTFDFILKPLQFERFKSVIRNLSNYIFLSNTNFIFNSNRKKWSIPYRKIIYIEKQGRRAVIHAVTNRQYLCNMNMEEILNKLSSEMFVVIRKSCVVNMSMITEITKDEIKLSTGHTLYVAREYKMRVKKRHLKFNRYRL